MVYMLHWIINISTTNDTKCVLKEVKDWISSHLKNVNFQDRTGIIPDPKGRSTYALSGLLTLWDS